MIVKRFIIPLQSLLHDYLSLYNFPVQIFCGVVLEDFSKVSDIMINTMLDEKAFNSSIKKATAFGFWKDIAGSKFSDFSTPYDIKGATLMVAVKNPQVMQELIFNQKKLIDKINTYFLPLNIKINDIRYDYKIWNKINSDFVLKGDDSLSYYSKEEIEDIELSASENKELNKVTNTITNLSFLDEKLKEKYKNNIINSIKVKKIREKREV